MARVFAVKSYGSCDPRSDISRQLASRSALASGPWLQFRSNVTVINSLARFRRTIT